MADVNLPKEQQTAYERWEMSSFGDDRRGLGIAKAEKTEPAKPIVDPKELAKIFEGVRKEAYTRGLQEGFAAGMANAHELVRDDKQHFLQLMDAFSLALEQSDEKIAEDVLALALDIAKSMLKVKLNVDPASLLPVVMDAIHYLPQIQQPARILVHRDDAQMLREYMADEIASQQWQIQEDHNIERGGCMIETGANQIDASNALRWKRISEALAQNNDWLLP
jgi:flagellar assembly protein FliH